MISIMGVARIELKLYSGWSFFKMYPMNAVLAGFDFDILPTAEVEQVYFHRSRENISELSLLVVQALIRAFGAMRLRDKIKFPITICRTQNSIDTPKFMRTANRQSKALRAIILSSTAKVAVRTLL